MPGGYIPTLETKQRGPLDVLDVRNEETNEEEYQGCLYEIASNKGPPDNQTMTSRLARYCLGRLDR